MQICLCFACNIFCQNMNTKKLMKINKKEKINGAQQNGGGKIAMEIKASPEHFKHVFTQPQFERLIKNSQSNLVQLYI